MTFSKQLTFIKNFNNKNQENNQILNTFLIKLIPLQQSIDLMNSNDFQSQTAAILSNLQNKLSKYLTLQYESSDIFEKFKALKKQHEEAITFNKQFVIQNEKQTYKRNQKQIPQSQFDKLMYRRKQCEAKLYQMLYDYENGQGSKGRFSVSEIEDDDAFLKPKNNNLMTNASLQNIKSQKTLSTKAEPNFQTIQNQLQNMQIKIQNLQKKINKKSKSHKDNIHQDKIKIKDTSARLNSERKQKQCRSQQNLDFSKVKSSSKQNCFKRSPKVIQNSELAFKSRQNSQQIANRHINYRCQQIADQTVLKSKLLNKQNKKCDPKCSLNESKLKKVGLSKFNDHKTKNSSKALY